MSQKTKSSNRLGRETSPYLKQHANNPVDWFPWGPEALQRSKKEQKPIFLSIGYSACHWCHVMERESFEDAETAKVMNEHFINIKVDREERQDLDHIYMNAVQIMTQHGGWPLSVFLTPDLAPFYGGTYFPPEDRSGMPSFKKVLLGVANAWNTRREEISKSAVQLSGALKEINLGTTSFDHTQLELGFLDRAVEQLKSSFDPFHGGFGGAPKFFHTMEMKLCLRQYRRTHDEECLNVVTKTLDEISRGGIYDQLGGGFHRYSTDAKWLVPHFEKMLYDNALLADLYLEAFQVTQQEDYARVARETLNYVLREMTSEEGGFFSTQDADSEGTEGKFYVWGLQEIFDELDREIAAQFCRVFEVSHSGNWDGHNILHRKKSLQEYAVQLNVDKDWLENSLALAQRKLIAARSKRIAPDRDEKVLVSWNGLMIHAMALGYQVLGDSRYLEAAQRAATFILEKMRSEEGRLLHTSMYGEAKLNGYLDDYANLICALLTLFESDFQTRWLEHANSLTQTLIKEFFDTQTNTFFFTATEHEALLLRPKEIYDGATPSGSSMAITALIRLGRLTGDSKLLQYAEKAIQASEPVIRNSPSAVSQTLVALDLLLNDPHEIVIVEGAQPEEFHNVLRAVREKFLPGKVVIALDDQRTQQNYPLLKNLLKDKTALKDQTTVYLCKQFSCQTPWVGLEAIVQGLSKE